MLLAKCEPYIGRNVQGINALPWASRNRSDRAEATPLPRHEAARVDFNTDHRQIGSCDEVIRPLHDPRRKNVRPINQK